MLTSRIVKVYLVSSYFADFVGTLSFVPSPAKKKVSSTEAQS